MKKSYVEIEQKDLVKGETYYDNNTGGVKLKFITKKKGTLYFTLLSFGNSYVKEFFRGHRNVVSFSSRAGSFFKLNK